MAASPAGAGAALRQVVALDNSEAMLELARQRCDNERLGNVELKLADALNDEIDAADCVVVNMVLHHFAAPAEALKQLARLVRPTGSLLITELRAAMTRVGPGRPAATSGWASSRKIWPAGPMPQGSRPARASMWASERLSDSGTALCQAGCEANPGMNRILK